MAIVAIAGGGCRVETAAQGAPGETIARYFFKPSHIDLVLGAAGLADGPIDKGAGRRRRADREDGSDHGRADCAALLAAAVPIVGSQRATQLSRAVRCADNALTAPSRP